MSDQPELGTPIPLGTISNATGEIHKATTPVASLNSCEVDPHKSLDDLSQFIVLPVSLWAAGVSAWLRIVQAQSGFPIPR